MPGRIARQRLPAREFIQEVIGQERTDVRTESSLELVTFDVSADVRPESTLREVRSYSTTLWGALFVPEHGDKRPFFEFINNNRYSVTTSKQSEQVWGAVNSAPRKYTPCFVVKPPDGRGWSPSTAGIMELEALLREQGNIFLDWLRENATREHPTMRFPRWGSLYLLENEGRTPSIR